MAETPTDVSSGYEKPELAELGTLHELTLGCDKKLGPTDGFTFQGQAITCSA